VALPSSDQVASFLLDAKANAMGHGTIGARGRRTTNIVLLVSTVLSLVAGAGVLADFLSQTTVGLISLGAAIASATAIACLQTLKSDQHLRLQGEYESVSVRLVGCDSPKPGKENECGMRYNKCKEDFFRAVEDAKSDKVSLTPKQVEKYRELARQEILRSNEFASQIKVSLQGIG
jgi:hypothetical protein